MPARPWRYVLTHQPVRVHLRHRPARRIPETVLLSVLARLVLVAARLRWRWRVTGDLPAGGAVLVSSHTSYWDGLLACALAPNVYPVTGRDFRRPRPLGWFLSGYGVLWTDNDPVDAAVQVLAHGGSVWIAPAGWEKRGVPGVRRGAAEIALRARAPVHLLTLTGLDNRPRGRLDVSLSELVRWHLDLTERDINHALRQALIGD